MTASLEQLVELLREHHPYAWSWDEEDLRNWVAWYIHNGLILVVSEDNKEISGFTMMRTVMSAIDGVGNTLSYDPEGIVAFIDFLYAPTDRARRGLVVAAIKRFGHRQWVAWERRQLLRVYPAARFVNHTLHPHHHGST